MTTEADIKLKEVKKQIQEAINSLSDIALKRTTSGWDNYSSVYEMKMRNAIDKLVQAREALK